MVGRFDFKGAGISIGASFPKDEGFLQGGFTRASLDPLEGDPPVGPGSSREQRED